MAVLEFSGGRWREDAVPIVVASALFMHLMDTAALATALPTIARAFGRDTVDLRFALTAYVITIAVLVPASAWLAARLGSRRLFVLSMIVFAVGSATCALSQNLEQLIAARVLQGAGGAMMTPVGRSLIVRLVARANLIRAMTLFTLPAIVAPLVGPPLAGLIVEAASWRWIFLINLPVCLLGVVAVLRLVPRIVEEPPGRFDIYGYALLAFGMLLLYALVELGAATPGGLLLKVALALALGCIWVVYRQHARRHRAPILDPVLLQAPTLGISLWSGALQRVSAGALPFLLPLLLQQGLAMSPLKAGQVMVASAAGGIAARFVIPSLIRRVPIRAMMILCGTAAALATAALASIDDRTPIWFMVIILTGLGLVRAGYFIPANAIAYLDLEPRAIGQATILYTMVQQFSLSVGISLSAALLEVSIGDATVSRPSQFMLPLLGVAGVAMLSLPWLWQLPADVGKELR